MNITNCILIYIFCIIFIQNYNSYTFVPKWTKNNIYTLMNNNQQLLGKQKLRKTNNKLLLYSTLVYINLETDDNFKLKCINSNGFMAIKICNRGKFIK